MRKLQRTFVFAAITAALFSAPARPVGAAVRGNAPVPVARLASAGPVRAGDQVELTWAAPDARVEELELLLSLDGGRSWHVRVSPGLPGASLRYRWTVPNLPSGDARIRVRMRIDGHELLCPAGEPFVIESDPARPLTRLLLSEGAWWTGFDVTLDVAAGFGAAESASLTATHAPVASEEGPRFVARAPALGMTRALEPPRGLDRPQSARADASAPECFPLRN